MTSYDWIVVGGGIIGSALGYELANVGFSVLLLEPDEQLKGATHYSYGGIAYWAANTDIMRQLCQESMERYPRLTEELGSETQFRELDLLLLIDPDRNPKQISALYQETLVPPKVVTVDEACEIEPLLNRETIAAALQVRHGHLEPTLTAQAYRQAMTRLGGIVQHEAVQGFVRSGSRIQGVVTSAHTYHAANVVVSAGGLSRKLLQTIGITVPVYYTHAEVVDMAPEGLHLSSLVMPAELKRFGMEATAGDLQKDALWNEPGHELTPAILDIGAVQFMNGRLRLGQFTRALTDPHAAIDAAQSEADIRSGVGHYLPAIQSLPGEWGHCLVAFSGDRAPLIGAIPELEGIHVFSGFSNPFAILPPLAQRYARSLVGKADDIIAQMSPARFTQQRV